MPVIPTILVQSKLVHQLYNMPTSWFTSITSCDVKFSPGFDWSTATKLKPKFETAQNATFSLTNIFFSNPRGGRFLALQENVQCHCGRARRRKWLPCCVLGARAPACASKIARKYYVHLCCVFFVCLTPFFCAFACI